ncbi:MAG: hypothetical protein IPI35_23890 [Deltaproteobacteria bacterium]|nr:hypothetical protein [Deltaproteobacteria bacterium]
MRLSNVTPDLPSILSALGDAPCWRAKRGYGTFITFDLGASVTKHGPWGARERGEFHLWIYFAEWNLKVDGRRVSWRNTPEKIDRTLARFIGRTIIGFSEHPACIRFQRRRVHHPRTPCPATAARAEVFLLYPPGERGWWRAPRLRAT